MMVDRLDTRTRTEIRLRNEVERRAHPRLDCSLLARCRAKDGLQWRGRAIDLSPSGVCVIFWSRIAPPHVAMLFFRDRGGSDIIVPAYVVHTRRQGNFWLVGCAFERPLTDEEFARLI
jgi:hypothetical protein